MKQILLILLTCFSLTGIGQPLMGIISSGNNNVSAPAPNWNVFSEGFEGTGYQNTWTESLGANPGNLADEDATGIAPVGGTHAMHIIEAITPTATAAAAKAQIYTGNFAAVAPIAYMDFYVQIHLYSLPAANNSVTLMEFRDGIGDPVFTVSLREVSGAFKLQSKIFNNGTSEVYNYPASGSVIVDTWYHIQMKYDVTNMRYSFAIDGNAVVVDVALTGTVKAGIKRLFMGDGGSVKYVDFYMDNLNISSTNF